MAGEDRPVAAIFRSIAFNRSEQFIQAQAASLNRYRPLVVAFKQAGELVPELDGRVLTPFNRRGALGPRLLGRLEAGRVSAVAQIERIGFQHADPRARMAQVPGRIGCTPGLTCSMPASTASKALASCIGS